MTLIAAIIERRPLLSDAPGRFRRCAHDAISFPAKTAGSTGHYLGE
jgi:hypothetical protein